MNDRSLGKGGFQMADERSGAILPAVDPCLEDALPGVEIVGVALEIIDRDVRLCGEAPQRARPDSRCCVLVDLVDLPVIGGSEVESPEVVAGLVDRVSIRAVPSITSVSSVPK